MSFGSPLVALSDGNAMPQLGLGVWQATDEEAKACRQHLDNGWIVIPKSVRPARIRSNFEVFGFHLDAGDVEAIGRMEKGWRLGPDPETFG